MAFLSFVFRLFLVSVSLVSWSPWVAVLGSLFLECVCLWFLGRLYWLHWVSFCLSLVSLSRRWPRGPFAWMGVFLVSWSPLLVALGFLLLEWVCLVSLSRRWLRGPFAWVSVSLVSWSPLLVVLGLLLAWVSASPDCFMSVFSVLLVSFSLVFGFLLLGCLLCFSFIYCLMQCPRLLTCSFVLYLSVL